MILFIAQLLLALTFVCAGFILFQVNILPQKSNRFSITKTAAKAKRVHINAEISLTKYEKAVIRIESLLKKLQKKRQYFYTLMLLCFVGGAIIGHLCFTSVFLSIASGIISVPLSYLILIFQTQDATRKELAELENTMSIITNSYMASNDVVRAVETFVMEKNRYVDAAAEATTPFDEFVADCLYLNPNIQQSLDRLAAKINNRYFGEWIQTLKLCIDNKNMRFALRPTIDAMVDEKTMQVESDTAMAKAWTEYITFVAVMFSIIPALRIAQKAWYLTLTQTIVGQGLLFAMLVAALLTGIYVLKLNRPIGEM